MKVVGCYGSWHFMKQWQFETALGSWLCAPVFTRVFGQVRLGNQSKQTTKQKTKKQSNKQPIKQTKTKQTKPKQQQNKTNNQTKQTKNNQTKTTTKKENLFVAPLFLSLFIDSSPPNLWRSCIWVFGITSWTFFDDSNDAKRRHQSPTGSMGRTVYVTYIYI